MNQMESISISGGGIPVLMSDSPIAYEQDGQVIYRASALGGCLTALAAARQGLDVKPVGEKMEKIYAAGHEAEDELLRQYPVLVTPESRQMAVELPITRRIRLVGHVDGLHGDRVGEIKSQSDDEFHSWTPQSWRTQPLWIKYSWQVSTYMLATNRELALIRVPRSDVEKFQIHVVKEPFWSLDDIRARVLEVEALAMDDTLKCVSPSFPCPYYYLHEEAEYVEDERLEAAVEDYLLASEEVRLAELVKVEARKQILGWFGGDSSDESGARKILLPGGVRVTKSVYDRKERVIPAGTETRITVTKPKEKE